MDTTTNGTTKPKTVEITDATMMGIIAIYVIQKHGRPTLKEIQATALEKLNCKLNARTLGRVLIGASRAGRNTIAINQSRLPEEQGGALVDVYSMKDPQRWRSPPEMAHITDLLPRLLSTPECQEIKGWFDKSEVDGKSANERKARGNDVDDYRNYSVLIYTLDPLLGSQIHCPYTDIARGQEPKAKVDKEAKPEMEGIFTVDQLNGDRIITSDVLSGWFVTNAGRYGGLADTRCGYLAFKPLRIPAKVKPIQLTLPVNNSKQGAAAPKSYEAIPPGQFLKIEFAAPSKGIFTTEQYEKLLHIAGDRPRRGLSPARGKRYGRYLVLGFTDHGAMKTGGIDFIFDNLSPELLKRMGRKVDALPTEITDEHLEYMSSAAKRLEKVEIRLGMKSSSDEPFPLPGNGEEDDENEE